MLLVKPVLTTRIAKYFASRMSLLLKIYGFQGFFFPWLGPFGVIDQYDQEQIRCKYILTDIVRVE